MLEENSKDYTLPLNFIYPDATSIFPKKVKPLEKFDSNKTIYVLDTNTLLLPYNVSEASLTEIKQTYEKMISKNSLLIPGQVIREFLKNRGTKISDIYQRFCQYKETIGGATIDDSVNKLNSKKYQYRLLENFEGYQNILKLDAEIRTITKAFSDLKKKYNSSIDEILQKIELWNWEDPVSSLYSEIFTNEVIYDLTLEQADVKRIYEEMELRYQYKIPPGYEDNDKDENNRIGDYLIWKTILDIGQKKESDIIFVSGEKKEDWWLTSYKKKKLYPRYELISEFNRISNGKNFYIIELSHLLEIYNAANSAVEEIKHEESIINEDSIADYINPDTLFNWLESFYSTEVKVLKPGSILDYEIRLSPNSRLGICVVDLDLINPTTIVETLEDFINKKQKISKVIGLYKNWEIIIFFLSKSDKQSKFIAEVVLEWANSIRNTEFISAVFVGTGNKSAIGSVYGVSLTTKQIYKI